MDELWTAGFITRYAVAGARYLEATDWDFWQKPKNPAKPRYPKSSDPRAEVFQADADFSVWMQSSVSVSGSVSATPNPVEPTETLRRTYGDSTENRMTAQLNS